MVAKQASSDSTRARRRRREGGRRVWVWVWVEDKWARGEWKMANSKWANSKCGRRGGCALGVLAHATERVWVWGSGVPLAPYC